MWLCGARVILTFLFYVFQEDKWESGVAVLFYIDAKFKRFAGEGVGWRL